MKRKIITSKIERGSLIQYSLDDIKRESFEMIHTEWANLLKCGAGVYAPFAFPSLRVCYERSSSPTVTGGRVQLPPLSQHGMKGRGTVSG